MKTQKFKRVLAGFLAGAMVVTSVAFTEPVNSYAAAKTVTVHTQKELNAALKKLKTSKKTIVIKTAKAKTFTIKKASYKKATLKVNAAKSKIVNKATFASVQIADAQSITEKGNANTITDKDKNVKLVIAKDAQKTIVVANKQDGTLNLVANGNLKAVKVKAAQKVVLTGSSTAIPTITVEKEGAEITTSIPVNVSLNANAVVTLNKGAEASSVKVGNTSVVATVQNNTDAKIVIKDAEGKETVVEAGQSVKTNTSTDPSKDNDTNNSDNSSTKPDDSTSGGTTTPGGSTSGGSTSGGTETPSTPETKGDVVTTLDELNKKLEESKKSETALTITYKSDAEENIEIPEGTYNNVTLVIDAPNATITNKAKFAKVELKRIATNTWIEKTTGNLIDIVAPNVHIQIPENCSAKIAISKAVDAAVTSSNVKIDNNGQIERLTISSQADVKIGGTSNGIVPVQTNSEGVSIVTTCPVQVTAEKTMTLDLQGNASNGSSVTVANDSVKAYIQGVGKVTVTNAETRYQSEVMAEPSQNTSSDPATVSKAKLTGTVTDTEGKELSATVYAFKYTASATNGTLEDAIKGMTATNHPDDVYVTITNPEGAYALKVPYGNYSLVIKADEKASYFRTVVAAEETVDLGQKKLQKLSAGNGSIEGKVTDAANGEAVPEGITIRLYEGENNTLGTPIAETTTGENGQYKFENVVPGYYTLQFVDLRKTEEALYVIASKGAIVTENATVTINQIISKRIDDGQVRFVLHWADEDENDTVAPDLDSHLVGPGASGDEKFHVYFGNGNYPEEDSDEESYEKYVDLDVDDTDYMGPETITIYKNVNGIYHYYVHNFTDRSADSYYNHQTRLATSKPYVEVIRGNVRIAEFNLAETAQGNVWDVCTYNSVTGAVTDINKTYFNDDDYGNLGADAAYYQKKTINEKEEYISYFGKNIWGSNDVTKAAQEVIDMDEAAIKNADADAVREVYDALHWEIVKEDQIENSYDSVIRNISYTSNGEEVSIDYKYGRDWNDDGVMEYLLYATEWSDESLPGISAWNFDVAENATVTPKTENDTDYVIVTIDGHSRTYKVIIQKKAADWPLGVSVNGTALEDSAWYWQFWDAPENKSGENEVIIYGNEAQFSGTLSFTVAEGKTATYVAGGDLLDGYIGKLLIKDVDDDDDDAIVFYVKYVQNEDTVDQEEPSDDVDEADQPQESSDFEVQETETTEETTQDAETETTEETTQETATEEVSASVQ